MFVCFSFAFGSLPPPGRRPYPPACKPYGLEAGPEAMPFANGGRFS